jgi:hypothetical protein
LPSQFPQIVELGLGILVERRGPQVERRALQNSSPIPASICVSSTMRKCRQSKCDQSGR